MNRNDIQSVMCGHRHVQYIIDQNIHNENIQWIKISIEAEDT